MTDNNKRLMGNIDRYPVEIDFAGAEMISDTVSGMSLMDYWCDEGVASLGVGDVFNGHLSAFIASEHPHRLPDIYPNRLRWDAAEIICNRTGMDRIFFSNSGTEANEAAIKLARKYWWDKEVKHENMFVSERNNIFTVEGNFHGRTGFSLAASDWRVSPYHRHGFGPFPRGFGVINDQFEVVSFDGYEYQGMCKSEPDWSKVAAIIMAPVLGNNCVKTYGDEFWNKLSQIRRDHGVLIIFDDVQAGSGRAGHFATWQGIGVKPDIMTLAKGIAMGLPMSATLAREGVAQSFTPGVHFNTFGGTLICCYFAIQMYKWLDDNLEYVRAKGEWIRNQFAERSWIKEFDGMGMLNAFTPDFEKYGYDGFKFIERARTFGLSLVTHRQYGAIRFTPPLNTPVERIAVALAALDSTHKSFL